jgi:hypothetical protein
MIGLTKKELKRMWKKAVMGKLELLVSHVAGGSVEYTKHNGLDSKCQDEDLKMGQPEYSAGLLITEL